ncbi:MAG: NIPSNAP family protein [Gemmatimonadota bacterium]|nr:NIPSNAP family protein [Gemmatimonadota bacterium]
MAAKRLITMGLMTILFGAGYALGNADAPDLVASAEASPMPLAQERQVFELRTYTAPEGKLDDLLARFRNHTMRIFEKHGMTNVGYWLPQDPELRQNTLVYLLAHPSREAGEQAWRDFGADPEWQQVSEESQRDGRIVSGVVRLWLDPTDFSPMM